MNPRIIILFILLLSGFCVNAQEYISLNGEWQFALAKTGQEAKRLENFSSPGFSSQKFTKIPVPSNWAVVKNIKFILFSYLPYTDCQQIRPVCFQLAADIKRKRRITAVMPAQKLPVQPDFRR